MVHRRNYDRAKPSRQRRGGRDRGGGATDYNRHGESPDPEFKMALFAILAAAGDTDINPKEIDRFASCADERSDPLRLAATFGTLELGSSNLLWRGGHHRMAGRYRGDLSLAQRFSMKGT